ncbi:MAG: DUF1653 domain-containing protein [Patescibacteria group bacterium]
MDKPTQVPANGFYYHYKHNQAGEINNYAYEVIGLGLHTEERNYTVLYRPLYKNTFLAPANYCARPYDMFIGTVEKDGKIIPRFQKILDPDIIGKLRIIKEGMYDN